MRCGLQVLGAFFSFSDDYNPGVPASSQRAPSRTGPPSWSMLQNDANAPSDLVERAKGEVARLFRLIEVEIAWATDVPEPGTRLRVVSITTWEPPDQKVQPSVLGYTQIAPGQRGIRGYVFWRRVERASHTFTASLDNVLAVAIAARDRSHAAAKRQARQARSDGRAMGRQPLWIGVGGAPGLLAGLCDPDRAGDRKGAGRSVSGEPRGTVRNPRSS